MKNGNHKDLQQSIVVLSLFASGLVISAHCSYPSITAIALGVPSSTSSSSSTAPTTNTTQSQITLLNNKGMSLYNLGRFNESIAYFDKALAIDPNNVTTLDNKGLALLSVSIKNYTQAITYFDKALAIDPKNIARAYYLEVCYPINNSKTASKHDRRWNS
jgi:tetratricopeptide (TPR) repeat protein